MQGFTASLQVGPDESMGHHHTRYIAAHTIPPHHYTTSLVPRSSGYLVCPVLIRRAWERGYYRACYKQSTFCKVGFSVVSERKVQVNITHYALRIDTRGGTWLDSTSGEPITSQSTFIGQM